MVQFFVDGIKVGTGLFFVAKDLDDLLAIHHFLDKALHLTDGFLLADEVFGGAAADLFGYKEYDGDADQHD